MADNSEPVAAVNAILNSASNSGRRRPDEAGICRWVRQSMQRVGLGPCYNWLAFNDFRSDLVRSTIMFQRYSKDRPTSVELQRRIAAAEVGMIRYVAEDIDPSRNLGVTELNLRWSMDDVFESFTGVLSDRPTTDLVSELNVALAKCKACYKRLIPDEKAYEDMVKSRGEQPGISEYTDSLESPLSMRRSVQATRKTYRALERDLFGQSCDFIPGCTSSTGKISPSIV